MIQGTSIKDEEFNAAVDKVIEEPNAGCDAVESCPKEGASSKKRARVDSNDVRIDEMHTALKSTFKVDSDPLAHDMLELFDGIVGLKLKIADLEKKLENKDHDFQVMNNFFKYASQVGDYESWWFWDAQREARGEKGLGDYKSDDPEHPNDILKSV